MGGPVTAAVEPAGGGSVIVREHVSAQARALFVLHWLNAGGDLDTIARAFGVVK